jgi:YD repeat-containing protein
VEPPVHHEHDEHQPEVARDDHASVEAVTAFEAGQTIPRTRGTGDRGLPDANNLLEQIAVAETVKAASTENIKRANGDSVFVDKDAKGAVLRIAESDGTEWKRTTDGKFFVMSGSTEKLAVKDIKIGADGSYTLVMANGEQVRRNADRSVSALDAQGHELSRQNNDGSRVNFDSQHHITSTTDASGAQRGYGYDRTGKLAATVEPDGAVWRSTDGKNWQQEGTNQQRSGEITINPDGSQTVKTARNETTTFKLDGSTVSRDAQGKVTAVKDADGAERRYAYDGEKLSGIKEADGSMWSSKDGGKTWQQAGGKDSLKAEISVDASGNMHQKYEGSKEVVKRTDGWTEVKEGDKTRVEKINQNGSSIVKNALDQVIETRDANGKTRQFEYNEQGRVVKVSDPSGVKTSTDGFTWMSADGKPAFKGRVDVNQEGLYREVREDGTKSVYKPDGSAITVDAHSRITRVDQPGGAWRAFEYNSDNRVTKVSDSSGNSLSTTDGANWKKEGSTETVRMNAAVRLDGTYEERRANGEHFVSTTDGRSLTYDKNNRIQLAEAADGSQMRYHYDSAGKATSFELTSKDGSRVNYDAQGHVSRTESKDHAVREYTYGANGKLSSVKEPDGKVWSSSDGENWSTAAGEKFKGAIWVSKDGQYNYAENNSVVTKQLDGNTLYRAQSGATRLENKAGEITETVDAKGVKRTYERNGQGDITRFSEGQDTWVKTDQQGWRNTRDGATWQGKLSVDKDGTYYQEDAEGNKQWRKPDGSRQTVNYKSMEVAADAIEYSMHGGLTGWGCDKATINATLENKTEAERKQITEIWNKKYGPTYKETLEAAFKDKMSGSDLDKAMALLKRPDGADSAGTLRVALTERGEWFGRSSGELEKVVRNTLETMNAADIAQTDQEYRRRYGTSLADAIQNDPNLSADTKAAAAVYMKGYDNRTPQETLDLARKAANAGNVDMFQEAMRRAPKEVRDYFASPDGQKLMKDHFEGHWYHALTAGWSGNITDTDYRHVQDYAEFGKLSVSSQTIDNTSWLGDNEKAIERSLSTMSDAERKSYALGRQIANNESIDPSVTQEQRQKAQDYYAKTSAALRAAAGQWYSGDSQINEFAKWEDMIAQKNGGLVSRLADHRGTIYDSSMQDVISTVENMSRDDWEKLHSDSKQRERIETVLKTYLSDDELKRTMSVVDAKMKSDSFEGSQQNRRPVLDAIEDNRRWYSNDEAKIYEAISNMTDSERALYKKGSQPGNTDETARTFAQALDQKLKDSLSSSEMQVANGLLDKVKRGEKPEMSIIDKLNVQASYTFGDKAQVIRDIQEAFDKDPKLQARIANPQTEADRIYAAQFKDAAARAMGQSSYNTYAKPLIETGHIPTELQLDLNRGIFNDDEQGAYKDIQRASGDEKQRILTDKAFQDRVLGFLSDTERQVALASMQQGEMRAEDKLRSYQLGFGVSKEELKQTLTELNDRSQLKKEGKSEDEIDAIIQQRLQHVRDEYARKYGTDLSADLVSELGGKNQREALRQVNGRDSRSEYLYALDQAATTRSGLGSGFVDRAWDGTGYQLDNEINQLSATMVQDPTKMREYVDNVYKAIDMHASSKEALADAIVDTTIAAVAVGGSFVSGGLSLSLLAYTGAGAAAFKVAVKGGIMGGDYSSGQLALDAGTGFAEGFTALIGAGVGKSAAEKVVAQAGKKMLIQGSEATLKEGTEALVKEGLKQGAKISDDAIMALAKQVAKDGDQQAVAALLKKSLGEAMEEQSRTMLKQLVMSTPQNALAGFLGSAGSGTIRAAHDARDFNEFVKMSATSAAFGTLGGAIGPFVLAPGAMAAGKAWNGVRAVMSREAATADNVAARAAAAADRRVPTEVHPEPRVPGDTRTPGEPRVAGDTRVQTEPGTPTENGVGHDVQAPKKDGAPETYVRTEHDQPLPKPETTEPYKVMEYKPQPGKPDVVAKPEAVAQSNAYKDSGEVRGRLEDGFQVVGGETRIGTDGNFHDPNRPAIVLDRSQDQVLRDTIAEAHARLDKYKNDPQKLAEELAAFSREKMQPAGWTNKQVDNADAMFRSQNGNNRILLGDYIQRAGLGEGAGACQPQALLMKVLGDDFGLDISMSTGYLGKVPPGGIPPGYSPNHAFTELHLKDQSLVYDPRNNISGTSIDRLPHLTPAREFRPGEAVTPETFQVKPGDVVSHDSAQWKITSETPSTSGDLVLRRDGQVSLTKKELAAANPDKAVKIGAEMEINVAGKKEGGWIVSGTNADGTVRLTKADAVKMEVSPAQLAAENAQIARVLGRDNQVLGAVNDLTSVNADLIKMQNRLSAGRMNAVEKKEIMDAIKVHLQTANPSEYKALARQFAELDLSQKGPAIKELLDLSAKNPAIDLKFALRADINAPDLEAYTSLAKAHEHLQDVPASMREHMENVLTDRLEIYSRTSKAADIGALRVQTENIADAMYGFSRNKAINPKIAENVAELLDMGADKKISISFGAIMDPNADVGAVKMYTDLTRQGLSIDIPATTRPGHGVEFESFKQLRDLAAYGKFGDGWVFVPAANASAADSLKIDGAFLNVKTKEWVPVDLAISEGKAASKRSDEGVLWAFGVQGHSDLSVRVRRFLNDPSVPHLSIDKLQPPFGTGDLPFPRFDRTLTQLESDANGRIGTTVQQIDALRRYVDNHQISGPEQSFYDYLRGRVGSSYRPRDLETKLASELMPNLGNAVDVRLHPNQAALPRLHPVIGTGNTDDFMHVPYIEFPRTNPVTSSDIKAIRVYQDGNVVGVDASGKDLTLGSIRNTMDRATQFANQTGPAGRKNLLRETPTKFDFRGKSAEQILQEYPSLQVLGNAVENPTQLRTAATNNLALDRAKKAVDADAALKGLDNAQRYALAREVIEARNALKNPKMAPSEVQAVSEVKKALPATASWQDALDAKAVLDSLKGRVSDATEALTIAGLRKASDGRMSADIAKNILDSLKDLELDTTDKMLLEALGKKYAGSTSEAVDKDILEYLAFYESAKKQSKISSADDFNSRYNKMLRMLKDGYDPRTVHSEALK